MLLQTNHSIPPAPPPPLHSTIGTCGITATNIDDIVPSPLSHAERQITINFLVDQSDLENCCVGHFQFHFYVGKAEGLEFPHAQEGDFDLVLTKQGTTFVHNTFLLGGLGGGVNNAVAWDFLDVEPVRAQGTWTMSLTYAFGWRGQPVSLSQFMLGSLATCT